MHQQRTHPFHRTIFLMVDKMTSWRKNNATNVKEKHSTDKNRQTMSTWKARQFHRTICSIIIFSCHDQLFFQRINNSWNWKRDPTDFLSHAGLLNIYVPVNCMLYSWAGCTVVPLPSRNCRRKKVFLVWGMGGDGHCAANAGEGCSDTPKGVQADGIQRSTFWNKIPTVKRHNYWTRCGCLSQQGKFKFFFFFSFLWKFFFFLFFFL